MRPSKYATPRRQPPKEATSGFVIIKKCRSFLHKRPPTVLLINDWFNIQTMNSLAVRWLLCLGAHAQARYTVVCLCVCVSVCVDCYSCSRINEVQVRVSIGTSSHVFLDFNSWICKIMLRSRVMARFAYLVCHCSLFRTVRSETCPYSVATLLSS